MINFSSINLQFSQYKKCLIEEKRKIEENLLVPGQMESDEEQQIKFIEEQIFLLEENIERLKNFSFKLKFYRGDCAHIAIFPVYQLAYEFFIKVLTLSAPVCQYAILEGDGINSRQIIDYLKDNLMLKTLIIKNNPDIDLLDNKEFYRAVASAKQLYYIEFQLGIFNWLISPYQIANSLRKHLSNEKNLIMDCIFQHNESAQSYEAFSYEELESVELYHIFQLVTRNNMKDYFESDEMLNFTKKQRITFIKTSENVRIDVDSHKIKNITINDITAELSNLSKPGKIKPLIPLLKGLFSGCLIENRDLIKRKFKISPTISNFSLKSIVSEIIYIKDDFINNVLNFEDQWSFLDYAVYHEDFLAVQLLSLHPSKVNLDLQLGEEKYTIIDRAIRDSSVEMLKLLLDIPLFEENISAVISKANQDRLTSLRDNAAKEKYNYLQIACQYNKLDHLLFLFKCGLNSNINEPLAKGNIKKYIIDIAYEKQYYQIMKILLDYGSYFPSQFTTEKLEDNELIKIVHERNHIEKCITSMNIKDFKKFYKEKLLNYYYISCDNHSAPYIAFINKRLDTYAFLRCQGFKLLDTEKSQVHMDILSHEERAELKGGMNRFANSKDFSVTLFLLSKSRTLQLDNTIYLKKIKKIYINLSKIPLIKKVLTVLEYSGKHIDIIFDFDSSNVEEISATPGDKVAGSCNFKDGRIFIGGNVSEKELIGTVAHELTHQAMQFVFNNDCNPFYLRESEKKAQLYQEIQKIESIKEDCDDIIKRVYGYKKEVQCAEMIVRVPHMLAKYGMEHGTECLMEQIPAVLDYFNSYIIPEYKMFVEKMRHGNQGMQNYQDNYWLPFEEKLLPSSSANASNLGFFQTSEKSGSYESQQRDIEEKSSINKRIVELRDEDWAFARQYDEQHSIFQSPEPSPAPELQAMFEKMSKERKSRNQI